MKIKFTPFAAIFFLLMSLGLSQAPVSAEDGTIDLLVPFPDERPIKIEYEGKKGAIAIMEQYVGKVFVFGAGLVSIVAVIWIMIGGYEIMFSGASSGDVTSGKDKIVKAIFGLVLIFLSALLLHFINPEFYKL